MYIKACELALNQWFDHFDISNPPGILTEDEALRALTSWSSRVCFHLY